MTAHPEPFDAVDVIRAKRDRARLTDDQIDWVVDAYTRGVVAEEHGAYAQALGLIQHYSRSPFQKALAIWLKAGPKPEHIHAAACKSPDRWAQGTAILGRLAGYSDRIELDQSTNRYSARLRGARPMSAHF